MTSLLKEDFVRSSTSDAARTETSAARAGMVVDSLILYDMSI